ncbi:MAG TPA: hypothetical protein VMD91_02985 [Candidatus Sulfotelmatobacter sp.]|nr:hypothetical protein [Candidatus Sulfotelmatobacter sp.]
MIRRLAAAAAALALAGTPLLARAATVGSAQLDYKVLPYVHASVTPNYASGFGVAGISTNGLGSGTTPANGSTAVLDGGQVDFGNVVVGYNYLYKYAAQVNVNTNDPSGFIVYAEGATDLFTPSASTSPLFQTLFWLPSSSGNTAFSSATSFNKTAGTPIGVNGVNGITYGGAPSSASVVWTSGASGSLSQGFDYELRPNGSMAISQFNVYIVYTVIGN